MFLIGNLFFVNFGNVLSNLIFTWRNFRYLLMFIYIENWNMQVKFEICTSFLGGLLHNFSKFYQNCLWELIFQGGESCHFVGSRFILKWFTDFWNLKLRRHPEAAASGPGEGQARDFLLPRVVPLALKFRLGGC